MVRLHAAKQPRSLTGARLGVGACLWDGAFVLTAYLAAQPADTYAGRLPHNCCMLLIGAMCSGHTQLCWTVPSVTGLCARKQTQFVNLNQLVLIPIAEKRWHLKTLYAGSVSGLSLNYRSALYVKL